MGLPYTYKGLYVTDVSLRNLFFKLKQKSAHKVRELNRFHNRIEFFYKSFFFLGEERVIITEDEEKGFFFEVSLEKLLKIAVLVIVGFAFLVKSIVTLLLGAFAVILIMYVLVAIDVHNTVSGLIDEVINTGVVPEKLSKEQLEWMKDPNRCPACGEHLSVYDEFCPECGLNLKGRRKVKKQAVSRTGFYNYRIFYTYVKEKD